MVILQGLILIIIAPLISGIITKIKNVCRYRRGPTIFQPYYNLFKYFAKDEVVSLHTSWIFLTTPYIVLVSTTAAIFLLHGDFLTLIFLLALGRFFLALGGLDPATTFGGMGSSREMFISSFVEPMIVLVILAVSLFVGTTSIATISSAISFHYPIAFAVLALFLITLAETSRIPIDNQETHLELTMIHEAMILEYSGRSLALLELAAYLKQVIFFYLISILVFPAFNSLGFILLKFIGLAIIISLTELSQAKMRLFKAIDFILLSGIFAFLALISLVLVK